MSRKNLVLWTLGFVAVLSAAAHAATPAPTSLVATSTSTSSITLTWVSNGSGSGFVVERSLDNRHYAVVGTTGANLTSFMDSGLAQNQLYLYRVKATGFQGDSDYSNWNFAVTRASVLSTVMPSDPVAVWRPGGGATLCWSDTFDGETGFKIERADNTGGFLQIAVTGPGATSYTDTAAQADAAYTYRIRATSAQGDSAYSKTAQVNHYGLYSSDLFVAQGGLSYSNLLAPPTLLSASAVSTSQINLTWQDNSNNETGFAVLWSFDNVHFQLLGTTAANVTTYPHGEVIFGIPYYYRVVAKGMTSAEIFSALASSAVASTQPLAFNAQLLAPSNLTYAAIPEGGVKLTWYDHSTNESGFAIERGTAPFRFSRIASVGPNVTSFTDPSGGLNYYRVQALSPSGDSVYSPPAGPSDTYYLLKPPPTTPLLTAATVSATHVNLSWSPANMWPIRVERSIDGVTFSPAGMAGGNQNAFQDWSAPPGTLCRYRIQLTHYTTNPFSNVATAATPGLSAPAAAPTAVSATGVSSTQINVKWAAVGVSVTSLTVERSIDGGATFAVLATLPPSNVSFSDAGLPAGSTASYRLRVKNPVGTSGYSNTATAGTLGADPAVTVTSKALGQHTRLTIQGTPANDTILVSQVGNTILVSVNGGTASSYVGLFGELVVKGGDGDDQITVDSSVSVEQVLVYGGKGNNVLSALGSGKQSIIAIGGGCDICAGNGINTSYWVDEAGVDMVHASPGETAACRVHPIKQFCQPYSFDPTNPQFVSKELNGQTWPEPFLYTFNFGSYLQRYPDNSLWGRSPVMFDINASYWFSCAYMAPFQSRVDKHPDVVQEVMVDLGDGTFAAQVGEPEDQAYARVDGIVAPGQCAVLGPSGDQWYLMWEKFFSFGNMNWNAPASVMGTATTTPINLQADGAAVYGAVKTALDQKKVLSCFTDLLNRNLDAPKSLYAMTHCYAIVEAYQSGDGNPCFILRNIYGIRDYSDSTTVNNLLTINPAQGLFTLNLKQLQTNFYGCYAQDCQFGGGGTQNQPPVIQSAPWANPNPVTLPATTSVQVVATDADSGPSPLTYTWSRLSGPTGGTVSFAPNGTVLSDTSTATFSAAGVYTLRVTVSDGAASVTGDVAVTVLAPNQAPVAQNQSVTTLEDTAKAITLAATDPESSPLTYVIVSNPTKGVLSGSGANRTYTPSANLNGTDSFTFKANDGALDSNVATVSIQITAVNDAPVARLTAAPTSGAAPLAVAFNASTSSDVDGTIATYAWNFGDGLSGSGVSIAHTYSAVGTYTAKLTVTDNLGAMGSLTTVITTLPTVTVSAYDANAAEPGTDIGRFQVIRSGSTAAALNVNYTLSGTAIKGTDYATLSGSVTIPAGAAYAYVDVVPLDDLLVEGKETVVLTLSAASTYKVGTAGVATVALWDNELPRVYVNTSDAIASEPGTDTGSFIVYRLATNLSAPLTVYYTAGGTATPGVDRLALSGSVTIPVNSTYAYLTITALNDALVEGPESVSIFLTANASYQVYTPSSASLTILDDEMTIVHIAATDTTASEPGTDKGVFTVSRRGGSTSLALTVPYTVSGTATSGVDFTALPGTVTIPAGATSATMTLAPLNDATIEGSEYARLTLTPQAGYQIDASTTYIYITDDDVPTVSITAPDASAGEPGTNTGTFSITRSAGTNLQLYVYFTVSGTALNGTDYNTIPTYVSLPAGASSATVTITPKDDTLVEGAQTVILTLSPRSTYAIGTGSATVSIADND